MLERQFNIDNYDSGPGVEDVIREEFRRLVPSRYSIRPGVIIDQRGYTSGDFDLVLFNDFWFTAVKSGATSDSRRFHLPYEGVYGVVEVKQTLTWASFDEGMAKLVTAHRLYRPFTGAHRQTENREGSSCDHGLTNPLYSAIVATGLADNVNINEVANRFFDICKTLGRLDVVRAICVLGHGTVFWGCRHPNGDIAPALFMNEDLCYPIVPMFFASQKGRGSALYYLMYNLLQHLYHSILGPEDLAALYGGTYKVMVPAASEIALQPDPKWLEKYANPCPH
ncbi:DUF6602 domain-containing protein [Enhygromyxa salina]|nr:DUF6602 domain-containing protein [Enhygromyxa salina]